MANSHHVLGRDALCVASFSPSLGFSLTSLASPRVATPLIDPVRFHILQASSPSASSTLGSIPGPRKPTLVVRLPHPPAPPLSPLNPLVYTPLPSPVPTNRPSSSENRPSLCMKTRRGKAPRSWWSRRRGFSIGRRPPFSGLLPHATFAVLQLVCLSFLPYLLRRPLIFDSPSLKVNVGLLFVPVSIYQMLRGALVLWVGVFSVIFLHRKLTKAQWTALATVMLGIAVVGCSSLTGGKEEAIENAAAEVEEPAVSPLAGVLLIIVAQVL